MFFYFVFLLVEVNLRFIFPQFNAFSILQNRLNNFKSKFVLVSYKKAFGVWK